MSAPVINSILEREAGRIGPDIRRKTLNSSVWSSDLVPVESFPEGMGDVIRLLTYERARALNVGKTAIEKQTWTQVAASNGEAGGSCLPPVTKLTVGTTFREYSLSHTAIESPDLCVNDLRGAFQRNVQLNNLRGILVDNTNAIVIERRRDNYRANCDHKVVVTTNGLVDDTTWTLPGAAPSKLTQGVLNKYYVVINRLGGVNHPLDRIDGAPYYGLICGMEQSEYIKQEPENRDAFIRSPRVSELLKPLGVQFVNKGYIHLVDPMPPRYNIVSSAWVEIQPWVPEEIEDSGHGYRLVPNDAYDSAVWEESFIFVPSVYSVLVPKTITSPGGETSFKPVDYRGAWKWKNIEDRDNNPDGTIGYFRGIYMDGAKSDLTELGVAFRHARCDLPLNLAACGS